MPGRDGVEHEDNLRNVIGFRFRGSAKIYYFDPKGLQIAKGTPCIVESARGLEYLECVLQNTSVKASEVIEPLKPILRVATSKDTEKHQRNQQRAEEIRPTILELVEKSGLAMRINHIEYTLDASKLLICFVSNGRVDFRELVKQLAQRFGCRIELRQINERDEFVTMGALGSCGRECCCAKGLEVPKTSMKMAKTQGLSLSMSKLAGVCGKMMCCLAYENEFYDSVNKKCPKVGSHCCLKDGRCCKVVDIGHLKGNVKLRSEHNDKIEYLTLSIDEFCEQRQEAGAEGVPVEISKAPSTHSRPTSSDSFAKGQNRKPWQKNAESVGGSVSGGRPGVPNKREQDDKPKTPGGDKGKKDFAKKNHKPFKNHHGGKPKYGDKPSTPPRGEA
ncbi:MAG: stage 0 sporulation protein [Firmicutes bacterium]|nr:stage 0 sporulation protein [Bacillota bacterium]